MKNDIKNFRNKLKSDGRSFRWFHEKYLRIMRYSTMMHQINGFSQITDTVKYAIKQYMAE